MTGFAKTAGLAGILVAVFATVTPDLKADQLNNAVREGQVGASAWPVPVISVPFAIGERQPVLRIRRLGDRIEVARVGGSA